MSDETAAQPGDRSTEARTDSASDAEVGGEDAPSRLRVDGLFKTFGGLVAVDRARSRSPANSRR
jgi:hypothetical protein